MNDRWSEDHDHMGTVVIRCGSRAGRIPYFGSWEKRREDRQIVNQISAERAFKLSIYGVYWVGNNTRYRTFLI